MILRRGFFLKCGTTWHVNILYRTPHVKALDSQRQRVTETERKCKKKEDTRLVPFVFLFLTSRRWLRLRQAVVRADGTPFDDMKIGRPDWIRMRFQDLGTKRKTGAAASSRSIRPLNGKRGNATRRRWRRRFQAAQIFRCLRSPTCSSICLASYFAFSFGPFCCAAAGYFLFCYPRHQRVSSRGTCFLFDNYR